MRAFGWRKWKILHDGFKKSTWTSLERWGLAYIHSKTALNELTQAVATNFSKAGKSLGVSIYSIWIDGTPQIMGHDVSGAALKGELADLLLILNETNGTGISIRRTGLLLQGKTSKRYNRLPSNPTTKAERRLLEHLDRSKSLDIYRNMKASPGSLIGKYTLRGGARGLKDCARYLIIAKEIGACPFCCTIAPFQIGWPKPIPSNELKHTRGIVEAIQRAMLLGSIGRQVLDSTTSCEWSRLVWDLVGDYKLDMMNGYGGQARINSSTEILAFCKQDQGSGISFPPVAPPPKSDQEKSNISVPAAISILQINIRYLNANLIQTER